MHTFLSQVPQKVHIYICTNILRKCTTQTISSYTQYISYIVVQHIEKKNILSILCWKKHLSEFSMSWNCQECVIFIETNLQHSGYVWAGPSEKGAYGFSDVTRSNDVNDVIHDITVRKCQTCISDYLAKYRYIYFLKI